MFSFGGGESRQQGVGGTERGGRVLQVEKLAVRTQMSSGFVVSGGGVCAGRPSGRVVVARRGGRRRALRVARCAVEDGGEVKGGDDRLIRPAPKRSDIVAEDEDEILLGLEDSLTEDERRVKKPNDPTELRVRFLHILLLHFACSSS